MSFRREEPAGYRPRQRVVLCTAGSEESNPIAEALTKERRTCKSFNGEIVWPPRVEAALVEGESLFVRSSHWVVGCMVVASLSFTHHATSFLRPKLMR